MDPVSIFGAALAVLSALAAFCCCFAFFFGAAFFCGFGAAPKPVAIMVIVGCEIMVVDETCAFDMSGGPVKRQQAAASMPIIAHVCVWSDGRSTPKSRLELGLTFPLPPHVELATTLKARAHTQHSRTMLGQRVRVQSPVPSAHFDSASPENCTPI